MKTARIAARAATGRADPAEVIVAVETIDPGQAVTERIGAHVVTVQMVLIGSSGCSISRPSRSRARNFVRR